MTDQLALFSKEPTSQGVWMTPPQVKAFDIFWDKFAKKDGKAMAQRAWVKNWKRIKSNLKRVYRAAEMEASTSLPEGQTRKWAQGWLNEPRWIDERFDEPNPITPKNEWSLERWREYLGPNDDSRIRFVRHHFKDEDMPDTIREEYGF